MSVYAHKQLIFVGEPSRSLDLSPLFFVGGDT
jgi:hypothetical protein